MKITYFLPLIFIGCSPQNYEDCVLKEIKEVTANEAVNAIKQACYAKFKEEKSTGETSSNFINPFTEPSTLFVDTLSYDTFQESIWEVNFSHGLKVEANEIIPNYKSILATNKNDETVTNITIGTSLTSTCLPDKNNYSQLISCQGEIPANSTNRIECKTSMPENVEFCVVSVEYQTWVAHPEINAEATPKPSIWQTIKEML